MQRSDEYEDSEVASTLAARDFKSATDLVAFNVTFCDSNGVRKDRPNGGLYVNQTEQANTLHAGSPSEQTMIAFQQNQREEVRELGSVVRALAASPGTHQQNYIAFMAGQGARAGGIAASETTSPTLKAGASGTNQAPTLASIAGVRRLTPGECESLQGFPQNWTAYGHDGKPQSDSTRYKQLGNAVCVKVTEWIGKQIVRAVAATVESEAA